jgi:hypothetical protein
MNSTDAHIPSASISLLANLLLTRMIAGKKAPPKSGLVKDLRAFFSDNVRGSDSDWKQLVSLTLEELATIGHITHPSVKIEITANGVAAVERFLGVKDVPRGMQWSALKKRLLVPVAIGTRPTCPAEFRNADSADGLKAALLVNLFDLPLNNYPSFAQAFKALLATKGVSISELRQGQLCDAIVQQWVQQQDSKATFTFRNSGLSTSPSTTSTETDTGLRAFVSKVQELATELQGESPVQKVLISEIWHRFKSDAEAPTTSRDQFDCNLLQANNRKLLTLSRADLPASLPASIRRETEVSDAAGVAFHFMRTEQP